MSETTATQGVRQEIYEAFRRMKEKDYPAAETVLQEGLKRAEESQNGTDAALIYSALGVLAKLKGNHREAWRLYEKAERLMPDDPSLKIIMAKLLMDQFAQYDAAIKKLKEVLRLAKGSASFEHQAHASLAVAYLKKGERKKAVAMFDRAMTDDFSKIVSAENLNFEVVEAFLARSFEVDRCRRYVEKGVALARNRKEEKPLQFLRKLLDSFEVTLQ